MAAPSLTNPPVSPSVSRPATFDAEADAHLAWQATNVTEMGAVNTWIEGQTAEVTTQAGIATAQAGIATTQAGIATTQAGVATTQAGIATTQAGLAATSAASALNAPGTSATSTTSLTIGAGAKSLTIQTGKLFAVGQTVVIARTSSPTTQMTAVLTAHDNSTGALSGTVAAGAFSGSGTYTDWTISLTGIKGAKGDTAALSRSVRTSNVSLGVADLGKLIDITVGTVQGLDLASVIGADWDVTVKNSTANAITIDPSGSDLIAGASTYSLAPSHTMIIQCDGTTFTVVSDSIRIERLHVLSTEASTKYALTAMLPMFDTLETLSLSHNPSRVFWTGSHFVSVDSGASTQCSTSIDGKSWFSRTIGTSNVYYVRNNGLNVVATYNSNPMTGYRSSDGGVTWGATANAAAVLAVTQAAYSSGGVYIAANATTAHVTTNNGVSWSALQNLPHTSTNLFAAGANLVTYNNASNTYYTSTTGLTGSWTSRALPDSVTAGSIWEDGSGGLVLTPTSSVKNYWRTTDGINWTDLGFNALTIYYAGLASATYNAGSKYSPILINGNWIMFNQSTAGAAGAGASVKYSGNVWVPMFTDTGNLLNIDPLKLNVASNGSGITVVKELASNTRVHRIDTTNTKCMGHFV